MNTLSFFVTCANGCSATASVAVSAAPRITGFGGVSVTGNVFGYTVIVCVVGNTVFRMLKK